MDLTKIAISIVGDASHYLNTLNQVVRQTQKMASEVARRRTGMFGAGFVASMSLLPLVIGADAAVRSITNVATATTKAATAAVQLGVEFERSITSFQVMLGNADKGKALFADLNQMALRNPFTTKQMLSSGSTLLGMSSDPDHVTAQLGRLTNIATGDPDKLRRLTYDFGETIARNQLDARVMRQFSTMGVGVKDFADTVGMGMTQFHAAMHNGEVGADVMVATINRLTNAGGRFYDMNNKQLKTVGGAWSNLVETVQLLAASGMMELFEKLGVASGITAFADSLKEMNQYTKPLLDWIVDFVRHLEPARADLIVIRNMFSDVAGKMGMTGADFGDAFVNSLTEAVILAKELAIHIEIAFLHFKSFQKENLPKNHPLVQLDDWLGRNFGEKERSRFSTPQDDINRIKKGFEGEPLHNPAGRDASQDLLDESMHRLGLMGKGIQWGDPSASVLSKSLYAHQALVNELKARGETLTEGKNWNDFMKNPMPAEPLMTGPLGKIPPKLSPLEQSMEDARKRLAGVRGSVLDSRKAAVEEIESRNQQSYGLKVWKAIFGGGGGFTEAPAPITARIGPEASKFALGIYEQMKNGGTPFEHFQKQMSLTNEAYLGVLGGRRTPFLGFDDLSSFRPGSELDAKQRNFAYAKNYQELAASLKNVIDDKLPSAQMRDTSAAQDTINRSNEKQLSLQEEMARNLAIAAIVSQQQRELLQKIADNLANSPTIKAGKP